MSEPWAYSLIHLRVLSLSWQSETYDMDISNCAGLQSHGDARLREAALAYLQQPVLQKSVHQSWKSHGNTDPAAACHLCCNLSAVVVMCQLTSITLARLQSCSSADIYPRKCSLSAQSCTISSSVICQLWLQCVSSAQTQNLSWAATLSICLLKRKLSARLHSVKSSAVCQPICIQSAPL